MSLRSGESVVSIVVYAGVAELVDAPDSKFGDGNIVSVRFRPPAVSSVMIIQKLRFVLSQNSFFLYASPLTFWRCYPFLIPSSPRSTMLRWSQEKSA